MVFAFAVLAMICLAAILIAATYLTITGLIGFARCLLVAMIVAGAFSAPQAKARCHRHPVARAAVRVTLGVNRRERRWHRAGARLDRHCFPR